MYVKNLDELKGKKFTTLYVDPAWSYSNSGTRGAAKKHYACMTIKEIKNLPVNELSNDNSHLHLWTTKDFVFDAKNILEHWGFCVGTGTRVLTSDLRWVKAESLNPGDLLLSFDEQRNIKTNRRYYRFSTILSTGIKILPCHVITLEDGTELIASNQHAWLMRTSPTGRESSMRWIKTEKLHRHLTHPCRKIPLELPKLAPVVEMDHSYESGFLSAAFDSDGSITHSKGLKPSFVQKDNALLHRVNDYLKRKNFSIAERKYDYLSTSSIEINGGLKESFRFFMSCRPPRLLQKIQDNGFTQSLYNLQNVPIKSVRSIGDYPVVTLMTDTGTYIAEGFGAHNTYKSMFIWAKPQMGMGNYWRVSHEILLFGMKGRLPFQVRNKKSWIEHPRMKHSQKPDVVREIIEEVSPGPYLEMFGRKDVEGWTVFGNGVL